MLLTVQQGVKVVCGCMIAYWMINPVQAQDAPPLMPNIRSTPLPPRIIIDHPLAASESIAQPITASQAAQIALANQPDINIARAALEAAIGRSRQATSGLYPNLGIAAGYTQIESLGSGPVSTSGSSLTGGASFPGWADSATIRQLLWDSGKTKNLVRQARSLKVAAKANLTRVQYNLVSQVKQAFYTYQQDERLVGVYESNLANRQAQLDLAQARLKAGLGLPLDVVRAQTSVSEAILNLTVAQSTATSSGIALALLMGIDPRSHIQTANSTESPPEKLVLDDLVLHAEKQRPDLLQAQENLRAAEYGIGAARSGSGPSLTAFVGTNTRGRNFPPNESSLAIGATLTWSIFDSGLTSGRIQEARGVVESAQAQFKTVQLAIISEVTQAFLNQQTALQRVQTTEAEAANAQEAVRLAEGRYKAGLGTFLDVIDAQAALLSASTNSVNAKSEVQRAEAALARAIGQPLIDAQSRE